MGKASKGTTQLPNKSKPYISVWLSLLLVALLSVFLFLVGWGVHVLASPAASATIQQPNPVDKAAANPATGPTTLQQLDQYLADRRALQNSKFLIGGVSTKPPDRTLKSPDLGDIFDQGEACDTAVRTLTKCMDSKITWPGGSPTDHAVPRGYYETPLPQFPQAPVPPKGFELEPDQTTCNIAGQWWEYCKRNVK